MFSDGFGYFALRADLIADSIDLIIFLVPALMALNKTLKSLKSVKAVFTYTKSLSDIIRVSGPKLMTRLGLKVSAVTGILSILAAFTRYFQVADQAFPYGLSVGGILAVILTKVFPTYTKYERKWGWWETKANYTYIKFW